MGDCLGRNGARGLHPTPTLTTDPTLTLILTPTLTLTLTLPPNPNPTPEQARGETAAYAELGRAARRCAYHVFAIETLTLALPLALTLTRCAYHIFAIGIP